MRTLLAAFAVLCASVSAMSQMCPSIPTVGLTVKYDFSEGSGQHLQNRAANSTFDNLLEAPENSFTTSSWDGSGVTMTDSAGTSPTGATTASRYLAAAGAFKNWHQTVSYPAGTYTVSCWLVSNTGANQSCRFGVANAGINWGPDLTVTTTWTQYSWTFTGAGTLGTVYLGVDAAGDATDMLIWGFKLQTGSTVTAYNSPRFDAFFGVNPGTDANDPSWVGKTIDCSGAVKYTFGVDAPTTYTNASAYALVKWTAAPQTAGSGPILQTQYASRLLTLATTVTGVTNNPVNCYINNVQLQNQFSEIPKDEWHVIAATYDGAVHSIYIDDQLVGTNAVASASISLDKLYLSVINGGANWPGQIGYVLIYNVGHSKSQVATVVSALKTQANLKSLPMSPLSRFIAFEGDSITAGWSASRYPFMAITSMTPHGNAQVFAVSGDTISTMTARMGSLNSYLPIQSRKRILSVLIGANDLASLGAATWTANLKTYCLSMKSMGWRICLGTVLPKNDAGFNTARATANTNIRNDSSFYDALADYDTTIMGLDATAADTNYYSDGLHPTTAGHAILAPVCAAALSSL